MNVTIFDIKRFAVHDGPGIRTTVFFKGCPLNCGWCHNPESRTSVCEVYKKEQKLNGLTFIREQQIGKKITVKTLFDEIEKDRIFYQESGGGVTFSGGEPLLQSDALFEISKICYKNNIHTTLDTTGYIKEPEFGKAVKYIALFLFDIKHIDNVLHKKHTGVSNSEIFNNLNYLKRTNRNVILRFPVVPGINTYEQHLEKLEKFLLKIRSKTIYQLDLLPYHKIGSDKYKRFNLNGENHSFEEPSEKFVLNLKKRFEKTGFEIRIGG